MAVTSSFIVDEEMDVVRRRTRVVIGGLQVYIVALPDHQLTASFPGVFGTGEVIAFCWITSHRIFLSR